MRILVLITLIMMAGASAAVSAQEKPRQMPADFKSDRCTFFPDGNYADCCVEHDKDYYFGGSRKERRRSDKRLYKCVLSKRGWQNKIAAPVMWLGVRVGGLSFLPTPFRWGFGKKKIERSVRQKQTGPSGSDK